MHTVEGVFTVATPASWGGNWIWGLPLVLLTLVVHVLGLAFITDKAAGMLFRKAERSRHFILRFVLIMSAITWFAITLHWIEAGMWALAYRVIGALPDFNSAMLYSLGALTSYGHANVSLEQRWQLLGPIEALNGWLLFGLTTAVMFATMQRIWATSGDSGTKKRSAQDFVSTLHG